METQVEKNSVTREVKWTSRESFSTQELCDSGEITVIDLKEGEGEKKPCRIQGFVDMDSLSQPLVGILGKCKLFAGAA